MPENAVIDQLQNFFPSSRKEDWARTARAELGGKDPFDIKSWSIPDGLTFQPYYDITDIPSSGIRNNFQLSPSVNSFLGARSWYNMPVIAVSDDLNANMKALEHLSLGADGIVFDVRQRTNVNFHVLLNKLEWPHCSLSFFFPNHNEWIEQLTAYTNEKNYKASELEGAFFWESFPQISDQLISSLQNCLKINSLGVMVRSSSPIQEIADGLTSAVQYVDELTDHQLDTEKMLRSISFSVPVGNNFLMEAAKLKSLRMLWFQVVQAYGIQNYRPDDLHIHARSEVWINQAFQPHGNMLKATLASMASVTGGCNALSVLAEDENTAMMVRIARNLSGILRGESYFDKVADPLAGAYAVENMVSELAEKSWEKFKMNIRLMDAKQ